MKNKKTNNLEDIFQQEKSLEEEKKKLSEYFDKKLELKTQSLQEEIVNLKEEIRRIEVQIIQGHSDTPVKSEGSKIKGKQLSKIQSSKDIKLDAKLESKIIKETIDDLKKEVL